MRGATGNQIAERLAHLAGQLLELLQRKTLQVAWRFDFGKKFIHQRSLSTTYRASVASASAAVPNGPSASQASAARRSARRRLSVVPNKPGNVSLPRFASLPTRLPMFFS